MQGQDTNWWVPDWCQLELHPTNSIAGNGENAAVPGSEDPDTTRTV
jgi:hypothetical protein